MNHGNSLKTIAEKLPLVKEYLKSSRAVYSLLKIDFDEIIIDRKKIAIFWSPKLSERIKLQAYKEVLHGGIVLALADSAGILGMVEAAKQNKRAYTSEVFNTSFLKRLRLGGDFKSVIIKGEIIGRKREEIILKIEIYQGDSKIMFSKMKYILK
ncbi:MAG: PaaI family thioesterase [Nanoarchaeota archaeon]